MRFINLAIKRFFDLLFSGLGLLILSPFLLIAALLIKILMPGPVFFRQERVGRNGRLFRILKLRTMKVDKQAEANHDFSKDAESRTRFGNFLRRTKIDELPQLINVFKGDMSLIGPRPTVKEQVDAYTDHQRRRLLMRPGMTGLAQVNGNVALTWDERIEYDIRYIDRFSVFLDLRILCKTVLVVLLGEARFKKPAKKAEEDQMPKEENNP
ncbi:MAG: sugar transferase [Clostridia bacterium]|nr:sugar transferase [Clostridia bacterium]